MKVMITGSRGITDEVMVYYFIAKTLGKFGDRIKLGIHGGASGVDKIADNYFKDHNIPVKIIRPIDSQKISYLYRNAEMVGMCDACIAIWDGKSKGTDFTMKYADARGKLMTEIFQADFNKCGKK